MDLLGLKQDLYETFFKNLGISMDNYLPNLEEYKFWQNIYKSDKSEVFRIQKGENHKLYVGKILKINIKETTKKKNDNLRLILYLYTELNNPSIPKLVGFSCINNNNEVNPVIITEMIQNGTLEELLQIERKNGFNSKLSSTKKLIIIYGIALGMKNLHFQSIIHRNLNPGSILHDESFYPKITKIGSCVSVWETLSYFGSSYIGEAAYIAPEIWKNKKYTKASDVYAFAMIVYEMMTNKKPFSKFNEEEISHKVVQLNKRPHLNKRIPYCYKKLILSCWSENPSDRPSFNEIVDLLKRNKNFILDEFEEEFLQFVDSPYSKFNGNYSYSQSEIKISNLNDFSQSDDSDSDSNDIVSYSDSSDSSIFYDDLHLNNSDSPKIDFNEYPFINIGNFEKVEKIA